MKAAGALLVVGRALILLPPATAAASSSATSAGIAKSSLLEPDFSRSCGAEPNCLKIMCDYEPKGEFVEISPFLTVPKNYDKGKKVIVCTGYLN